MIFFFSSRRRHTRYWRDWSSDVCSSDLTIVVGGPDRELEPHLPEGTTLAVQRDARGTGDAVRAGMAAVTDLDATVLVLCGDVPLITADAIAALVREHERSDARATVTTMVLADPAGYGRVKRNADGSLDRIVETKTPGDATPEELAIDEVNAGIYAFDARALNDALTQLG